MNKINFEEVEQVARANYWVRLINYVESVYNNPQIIQQYVAERNRYKITKTQLEFGRNVWSAPDAHVDFFLKQYFEPKYGKQWKFHKEVLNHELIKPWLLIPLKEVK